MSKIKTLKNLNKIPRISSRRSIDGAWIMQFYLKLTLSRKFYWGILKFVNTQLCSIGWTHLLLDEVGGMFHIVFSGITKLILYIINNNLTLCLSKWFYFWLWWNVKRKENFKTRRKLQSMKESSSFLMIRQ